MTWNKVTGSRAKDNSACIAESGPTGFGDGLDGEGSRVFPEFLTW